MFMFTSRNDSVRIVEGVKEVAGSALP